jgi:hypothetical protein
MTQEEKERLKKAREMRINDFLIDIDDEIVDAIKHQYDLTNYEALKIFLLTKQNDILHSINWSLTGGIDEESICDYLAKLVDKD